MNCGAFLGLVRCPHTSTCQEWLLLHLPEKDRHKTTLLSEGLPSSEVIIFIIINYFLMNYFNILIIQVLSINLALFLFCYLYFDDIFIIVHYFLLVDGLGQASHHHYQHDDKDEIVVQRKAETISQ